MSITDEEMMVLVEIDGQGAGQMPLHLGEDTDAEILNSQRGHDADLHSSDGAGALQQ